MNGEDQRLSVQMTCKCPLGTLCGDVKHLFLISKRGSRRAINTLFSPRTTSSILQIEAVCGSNMNSAASENGLVALLLALSGTVQFSCVSRSISEIMSGWTKAKGNECEAAQTNQVHKKKKKKMGELGCNFFHLFLLISI